MEHSTNIQTVYSTDTTTIAASAGFIAIESSIPGSQKRAAAQEESVLEQRQQKKPVKYELIIENGKPVAKPTMYP